MTLALQRLDTVTRSLGRGFRSALVFLVSSAIIACSGRVAAVRRFQIDSGWIARVLPPLLAERS